MDKIIIYPIGGVAKFKLPLNISVIKEFIILISGPLSQFIAYYLLLKVCPRYQDIIELYHFSILIFNLLPIYPLDGGKLVNLLLSIYLPFKSSLKITIFISYIMIILLVIVNYNNIHLNLIIMVIFLFYKVNKEYRQIDYLYNRFLLERYLGKYNFKKSRIINNSEKFYRNKRHLIKEDNKYYLEDEYLEKKYKKVLTL